MKARINKNDFLNKREKTLQNSSYGALLIYHLAKLLLFGNPLYNLVELQLCQIVSDFRQIVYTFWQKNHPTPECKIALKTQE